MLTKDNALITMFGQGAVRAVIGSYEKQLMDTRLEAQGLDRAWLSPIEIDEGRAHDTGTAVSRVSGDDEDDGQHRQYNEAFRFHRIFSITFAITSTPTRNAGANAGGAPVRARLRPRPRRRASHRY